MSPGDGSTSIRPAVSRETFRGWFPTLMDAFRQHRKPPPYRPTKFASARGGSSRDDGLGPVTWLPENRNREEV